MIRGRGGTPITTRTTNRLKWIATVGPIAALALLLYLTLFSLNSFLRTPSGFVLALALVALGVVVFSQAIFRIIDLQEQQIIRQNSQLATSASVAVILSGSEDTLQLLQKVLDIIIDSFALQAGVICLLNENSDELLASAHNGLPPELLEVVRRQKVSAAPIGEQAIRSRRSVVVADMFADPRLRDMGNRYGFRSLVSVPLLAEGRAVGVMALASTQRAHLGEADVQLLEQVARQMGVAVEKSALLVQFLNRNEDLRLLNDVSTALSSTLDLQEVMRIALENVLEVSGARRAEVRLQGRGRDEIVFSAHRYNRAADPTSHIPDAFGHSLRQTVIRTGVQAYATCDGVSCGCLAVQSEGRVVGTIYIEGLDENLLNPHSRQVLESIVGQSSVAISNAQLHTRAREFAVVEEQERLAREMHDGLAQVLGYVNAKAFAIRRLLGDGNSTGAQTMLAELEEAAREVYADVREGVLALRSTAPRAESLFTSVSDYAEKLERMTGMHVECSANPPACAIRLPEMSEIQVMRIVQEALSNVRKHSEATNVSVRLDAGDETLTIRVEDDGCGFDTANPGPRGWPQFGLQTMRERAEAVGGDLTVVSTPAQGTQVVLRVPLAVRRLVRG